MDLAGEKLLLELQNHSQIERGNFIYHFQQILQEYEVSGSELTLDQLREILSDYLQNLILESIEAPKK